MALHQLINDILSPNSYLRGVYIVLTDLSGDFIHQYIKHRFGEFKNKVIALKIVSTSRVFSTDLI